MVFNELEEIFIWINLVLDTKDLGISSVERNLDSFKTVIGSDIAWNAR